ncbi:hypothetical protein BH20ACI3_BH20ACI3_41830 [soil metagenome]
MKQSSTIKREVDELEKRREQLARELSKAIQANSEAQAELVKTGSDESMRLAAITFASFSSLKQAVETVDKQLEEKRQQLLDAQEYEGLADKRARAAECDREIKAAQQEYNEGREKAHKALEEILPGTFAAYQRHKALWQELHGLRKVIAPGEKVINFDRIENENLEFGYLVDQGLQHLANVERRGTREDRKAKAIERNKRASAAAERREAERKARELEAAERGGSGFFFKTKTVANRNPQTTA